MSFERMNSYPGYARFLKRGSSAVTSNSELYCVLHVKPKVLLQKAKKDKLNIYRRKNTRLVR